MRRPVGLADEVHRVVPEVRAALRETGLVRIVLDRPLSTGELLDLADQLGGALPQPGTHALSDYVERDLVFNLRQDVGTTNPEDPMTMVSTNPLNLHSEISMRPLALQPRFVLLHCVDPPELDRGGQTVVVPMAGVVDRLSMDQQAILRHVKLRDFPETPPVLRWEGDLPVLCFRDWEMETLAWEYLGPDTDITATQTNEALASILHGMHEPANTWGVHWTPGSVLIWDNWRYFHGRTHVRSVATRRRHLQRLYLSRRALIPEGKEEL